MTIPHILHRPALPLPAEAMSVNKAALWLGTGRANVEKIVSAQYVDSLTKEELLPFRVAGFISANRQLPLIQTAPAERCADQWRTHIGDSPILTNQEWVNAARGDWTGVSADRVLGAGYALVGMGGLITGVLKIIGVGKADDPRKVRFEVELLGRLISDLAAGKRHISGSADQGDQKFSADVLGKRYEPRAGGSMMWL